MCPSLIQIGSKTAEKKLCTNKQTDRQTNRHYENNGHLAVNQLTYLSIQNSQYIQHYDNETRIKNIDKIHVKNLSCRMSHIITQHV